MKYCKKCGRIEKESDVYCSVCRNSRLEEGEPDKNFPVVAVRAAGFEKQRICSVLDDADIPYSTKIARKQFSADAVTGSSNADYDILVPYGFYAKTRDILIGINVAEPDENDGNAKALSKEEEKELSADYYSTKNKLVRAVAIILFLAVVAGIVMGVDAVMALIKGFMNFS